jgi:hypothetical protein
LGQRSRKRGRRSKPGSAALATAPSRSAKTISPPASGAPAGTAPATPRPPKPPSRSEQRDAAVRAKLDPLAPGERPWPVKIGALIALFVGAGDLIDVIVGGRITFGRTHAGVGGVVLFSVMMIVCAVGMWKMRYWAVLGFQAILAIVILIFSLLLIRASNLLGFLVAIVIVFGGGFLFYKLVRTLSRIQMPKYPGP